jgi:legumain
MVIYVEACESGSMFDTLLPKNINIFAMTAANATESSYACYYDPELQTYLGDEYSVYWLEDSDRTSISAETVQQQYTLLKQETNLSHVQEYGDLTIGSLKLTEFQGPNDYTKKQQKVYVPCPNEVESGEVPVHILVNKIATAESLDQKQIYSQELTQMLSKRQSLIQHFSNYVNTIKHLVGDNVQSLMTTKQVITNEPCYRQLVDTFHQKCFNLNQNPFALRKLHVLVNVCESLKRTGNSASAVSEAVEHMKIYCGVNVDNNVQYIQ